MTQATIPFNLMKVHLMVAVVGRLFQKWFPAEPNLSYTFIWDKTDAYNQRVYGLSEAVGEYTQRSETNKYIYIYYNIECPIKCENFSSKYIFARFSDC